jgi:hypothetical protein
MLLFVWGGRLLRKKVPLARGVMRLFPRGRQQPPTCSDNSANADWCPRA